MGDTWTVAQIKAAANFLKFYESMALDLLVQSYNQGISAVLRGVRAPIYLDRFNQSLLRLKKG